MHTFKRFIGPVACHIHAQYGSPLSVLFHQKPLFSNQLFFKESFLRNQHFKLESTNYKMDRRFTESEEAAMVPQHKVVESVVKAASSCNKAIINNCSMCTLYCDKQVAYETVVEQYSISSQLGDLFNRLDNGTEVQEAKEFLFDEDSVVKQAYSRSEDDE